jgi:homoserine dehydrogenase
LIAQLAALSCPQFKTILIANSKTYISSKDYNGIDPSRWKSLIKEQPKHYTSFEEIYEYLQQSNRPIILIDNTASEAIPAFYPRLLHSGISIATPNKKGVSGQMSLFNEIKEACRQTKSQFYYEATVGAGLPIISTLQDLIQTGDTVQKIEGIFSGTLSYIFNQFANTNAKFSEIVSEAKEKGYTEPDPRDDLNGMDVARKLTILARTIGINIDGPPSNSIFPIEGLIPSGLSEVSSAQEFLAGLSAYDEEWDRKRSEAKRDSKVLRYVGSVDVLSKEIKVSLQT